MAQTFQARAVRLTPLFSSEEIASAVRRLASEIRRDYEDKNPVLVGILKGSFIFLADLVRCLDMPLEIEFVRLASYGAATETSGRVRMLLGIQRPLRGRHVLVVDDILDTGLTLDFLMGYLRRRRPASVKLCVLMMKRGTQQVTVPVDYQGLQVGEGFVVGYGLDWDQKYRHLPQICQLERVEHG